MAVAGTTEQAASRSRRCDASVRLCREISAPTPGLRTDVVTGSEEVHVPEFLGHPNSVQQAVAGDLAGVVLSLGSSEFGAV